MARANPLATTGARAIRAARYQYSARAEDDRNGEAGNSEFPRLRCHAPGQCRAGWQIPVAWERFRSRNERGCICAKDISPAVATPCSCEHDGGDGKAETKGTSGHAEEKPGGQDSRRVQGEASEGDRENEDPIEGGEGQGQFDPQAEDHGKDRRQ